jgi:hypothetical protein
MLYKIVFFNNITKGTYINHQEPISKRARTNAQKMRKGNPRGQNLQQNAKKVDAKAAQRTPKAAQRTLPTSKMASQKRVRKRASWGHALGTRFGVKGRSLLNIADCFSAYRCMSCLAVRKR